MFVKDFMLGLDRVVTKEPNTLIEEVLGDMLDNPDCGAIVIVQDFTMKPVGIVSKTDLMKAYKMGLDPKVHKVQEIMSTTIETMLDTCTRDEAATHFEQTKHKNAFVVDKEHKFVGMISALGVCSELALDNHAWPWNRGALASKYLVP